MAAAKDQSLVSARDLHFFEVGCEGFYAIYCAESEADARTLGLAHIQESWGEEFEVPDLTVSELGLRFGERGLLYVDYD